MNMSQDKVKSISPGIRMAELIDDDPRLLSVLERLGIRLGFGEETVDECCRHQGRDVSTFLMICRIHSCPDFVPSAESLRGLRLEEITLFLHRSHESFKSVWLVRLNSSISEILRERPEGQRRILVKFFDEFKDELLNHFDYEEKRIFPVLEALAEGRRPRGAARISKEHSNFCERIQSLIDILMKYLTYDGCDPRISALLFDLYHLKDDLTRHSALEDKVILPMLNGEGESSREELSSREKEILTCIAKGMLNKEMAYDFNISIYTVMTHRKNITRKTGIKSVAGLTAYALLNGLIELSDIK